MENKLLVFGPGYADPSFVIDQLAKKFNEGFDRIVLSYPERGTRQGITKTALGILEPLQILRKSYDFVGYIGHSMGGLVGRELLRLHGPSDPLFDAYVSVGTPHRGTTLAGLRTPFSGLVAKISPSVRDMRPGSKFLTTLNEDWCQKFGDIPTLCVGAGFDELVWPQNSADLATCNSEYIKIPNTDHLTVATSVRTYQEIWGFITYEILQETSSGTDPGHLSQIRPRPS